MRLPPRCATCVRPACCAVAGASTKLAVPCVGIALAAAGIAARRSRADRYMATVRREYLGLQLAHAAVDDDFAADDEG